MQTPLPILITDKLTVMVMSSVSSHADQLFTLHI